MPRFHVLNQAIGDGRIGQRAGDVVIVKPDEAPYKGGNITQYLADRLYFSIIVCPQIPMVRAQRCTEQWHRPCHILDKDWNHPEPGERVVKMGERRWRFKLSDAGDLDPGRVRLRAQLARRRWVEIARADLGHWIEDRMLDAPSLAERWADAFDVDKDARKDPRAAARRGG